MALAGCPSDLPVPSYPMGTGALIGGWLLGRKLGAGGNAVVWEATRGGDAPVALKVLNTLKASQEPYRRFVREVETMRSLAESEGVLPLLDAHLPSRPSRRDPAWLAMPIATPISEALAGRPLEEVVRAMAGVAATLAHLTRSHQLAHRDVKPGNLYELQGEWLVGDFGLVAVPDVEELTKSGRPLGPAHFTAYEMIVDPLNADPHPADVYSLAKTLWVLAVDQRFPPSGHQPGVAGYTIADLRPHRHADALDRLVERATRLRPEERPAMEDLANDLASWLELSTEPLLFDVSDVRSRLRAKLADEFQELDTRERRIELAHAAIRRLNELVAPLNAALREVHPRAEIDVMGDRLSQNLLRTHEHAGSPTIVFRWQRCSMIGRGQPHHRFLLRMARGVELEEGGDLVARFMVHVGPEGMMGNDYDWLSDAFRAPVGSIAADRLLEQGVTELGEHLQEGLRAFEEKLPP
jgi:serine/threonine protein kinase